MYRKILSIFISCAIAASLLFTGVIIPVGSKNIQAEVYPCAGKGNVEISSDPASLSQPGEVTVSVKITNTNSPAAEGANSVIDAKPTDEPEPTAEPEPEPGAYTNINIVNVYGAVFTTSNIPAGKSKTFTATMNVKDEMIGLPLVFIVSWFDQASLQNFTRELTLTITRGDTVYLKVNRTVGKKSAAPGETITFTYTLTNTGTMTLNEIKLVDKEIAGAHSMLKPFTLVSGESKVYEYNYIMGDVTVTSKPVVTFVPEGSDTPLSVTAARLTIGLENPRLTKEIVQGVPTPEGIPFTMYFTNIGNKRLSSLTVTDELGNKITAPFNLAFGETKYIEYTVPDPQTVRNVVFKISGNDENGGVFADHTQAFTVRPYIDPSSLGLDFKAEISKQLGNDNMIGLTFTLTNTGIVDFSQLTLTEETLNYELYRLDKLSPQDGSVTFDINLNVGGERELVFILNALDTSENPHTYTVKLNASYYDPDAVFPNDPPQPNDPGFAEDQSFSAKLDGLLTGVGEKMVSWLNVLLIVAIVIAVIVIALLIAEILMRKKIKEQRRRRRHNNG